MSGLVNEGDVAVVGGGLIGLAVAFELAGRGATVRVYDRSEPVHAASWAGAGMLAPHSEGVTDEGPELSPARDVTADIVLHDAVWTALSALPARQRMVVVLRYYEDLTEAETAQALGISVGTVKSTTARALAKMRQAPGLADDVSPGATPSAGTSSLGVTL